MKQAGLIYADEVLAQRRRQISGKLTRQVLDDLRAAVRPIKGRGILCSKPAKVFRQRAGILPGGLLPESLNL